MKNRTIPVIFTAAITSIVTLFAATKFQGRQASLFGDGGKKGVPVNYVGYNEGMSTLSSSAPVDFQPAAEASVKAVVHIKTKTNEQISRQTSWFGEYYAVTPEQRGSGSGVVVSDDGYIVTNNHVVNNADEVTVTFNDRYTTTAKLVGKDPSTDLAVLKVEETNLPFMEFGNSDDVRLGQWVLAVGYPFTLDATVTAGIVSAKSRSIGINGTRGSGAVESFIQTDAAVNPGNSGGALVNMNGQLVGINSAIASPTGSYAGYSYSIPANIARKVVNDIISTGAVQRGYLGINFYDRKELTAEKLRELGIDRSEGVYVAGVQAGSGAANAGIKTGDFITQINNVDVRTEPELLEKVATYKPGDNISVTYRRGDDIKTTTVTLKKLVNSATEFLGATFKVLGKAEKSKYGIRYGLMVTKAGDGALAATNMKDNFIILSANGKAVNTTDDLRNILKQYDSVQLEGFYPNQSNRGLFYYGLKKSDME